MHVACAKVVHETSTFMACAHMRIICGMGTLAIVIRFTKHLRTSPQKSQEACHACKNRLPLSLAPSRACETCCWLRWSGTTMGQQRPVVYLVHYRVCLLGSCICQQVACFLSRCIVYVCQRLRTCRTDMTRTKRTDRQSFRTPLLRESLELLLNLAISFLHSHRGRERERGSTNQKGTTTVQFEQTL